MMARAGERDDRSADDGLLARVSPSRRSLLAVALQASVQIRLCRRLATEGLQLRRSLVVRGECAFHTGLSIIGSIIAARRGLRCPHRQPAVQILLRAFERATRLHPAPCRGTQSPAWCALHARFIPAFPSSVPSSPLAVVCAALTASLLCRSCCAHSNAPRACTLHPAEARSRRRGARFTRVSYRPFHHRFHHRRSPSFAPPHRRIRHPRRRH